MIMNDYYEKWSRYIKDHNIPEDDERNFTWGWQFDETDDFITTPELLLACYIYGYENDAINNLKEHFIDYPDAKYTEMAKQAINLYNKIKGVNYMW